MPDIKLGPEGSETTLPTIKWRAGSPPELPVTHNKQVETSVMSDGSIRVNFIGIKKEFVYENANITKAELDVIEALVDLNQILRFQNNWEDATWYYVYVSAFSHKPYVETYTGTTKYACSLSLKEV